MSYGVTGPLQVVPYDQKAGTEQERRARPAGIGPQVLPLNGKMPNVLIHIVPATAFLYQPVKIEGKAAYGKNKAECKDHLGYSVNEVATRIDAIVTRFLTAWVIPGAANVSEERIVQPLRKFLVRTQNVAEVLSANNKHNGPTLLPLLGKRKPGNVEDIKAIFADPSFNDRFYEFCELLATFNHPALIEHFQSVAKEYIDYLKESSLYRDTFRLSENFTFASDARFDKFKHLGINPELLLQAFFCHCVFRLDLRKQYQMETDAEKALSEIFQVLQEHIGKQLIMRDVLAMYNAVLAEIGGVFLSSAEGQAIAELHKDLCDLAVDNSQPLRAGPNGAAKKPKPIPEFRQFTYFQFFLETIRYLVEQVENPMIKGSLEDKVDEIVRSKKSNSEKYKALSNGLYDILELQLNAASAASEKDKDPRVTQERTQNLSPLLTIYLYLNSSVNPYARKSYINSLDKIASKARAQSDNFDGAAVVAFKKMQASMDAELTEDAVAAHFNAHPAADVHLRLQQLVRARFSQHITSEVVAGLPPLEAVTSYFATIIMSSYDEQLFAQLQLLCEQAKKKPAVIPAARKAAAGAEMDTIAAVSAEASASATTLVDIVHEHTDASPTVSGAHTVKQEEVDTPVALGSHIVGGKNSIYAYSTRAHFLFQGEKYPTQGLSTVDTAARLETMLTEYSAAWGTASVDIGSLYQPLRDVVRSSREKAQELGESSAEYEALASAADERNLSTQFFSMIFPADLATPASVAYDKDESVNNAAHKAAGNAFFAFIERLTKLGDLPDHILRRIDSNNDTLSDSARAILINHSDHSRKFDFVLFEDERWAPYEHLPLVSLYKQLCMYHYACKTTPSILSRFSSNYPAYNELFGKLKSIRELFIAILHHTVKQEMMQEVVAAYNAVVLQTQEHPVGSEQHNAAFDLQQRLAGLIKENAENVSEFRMYTYFQFFVKTLRYLVAQIAAPDLQQMLVGIIDKYDTDHPYISYKMQNMTVDLMGKINFVVNETLARLPTAANNGNAQCRTVLEPLLAVSLYLKSSDNLYGYRAQGEPGNFGRASADEVAFFKAQERMDKVLTPERVDELYPEAALAHTHARLKQLAAKEMQRLAKLHSQHKAPATQVAARCFGALYSASADDIAARAFEQQQQKPEAPKVASNALVEHTGRGGTVVAASGGGQQAGRGKQPAPAGAPAIEDAPGQQVGRGQGGTVVVHKPKQKEGWGAWGRRKLGRGQS